MKNIISILQVNLNKGALLGIKLFNYLFVAFIVLFTSNLYAQSCANYVVTRDTAVTYISISGSSPSLFTWRNTTSNQNDDNRSYQAPIGFDFWYLGVRYTQFSADLNGFIDFSSSTSDGNSAIMSSPYAYAGNYMNVFSTANASMLSVASMYDDLWTAGSATTPIANSLVYKTSGSAPNRILTVEWINFDKYGSSSGSINFQIKLHETTGVIEFIYGIITAGSAAYVYCNGINSNWTSGSPTAAQLKTQQTANATTYSNTAQNSLSVKPTSNSKLTFTPPTPSAAPTVLTFSSISKTGMTLNWHDNANNEDGYVLYNSTDNINFSFASQTAVNATSAVVSGLNPSTTYYWRVYAVTEGKLSSALTGTYATSAASAIISRTTGNWSSTSSWVGGVVPSAGDNVTIANSHIITLDADISCNSLIIGQGSSGQFTIGNNTTARTISISSNITVNAGATLTIGSSSATHILTVGGNITNNGTINLGPSGTRVCDITFNKNGNQTISGTGITNTFNLITLNMGTSNTNVLEVTSSHFSAATNFLTLTNGTFKLSSAANVTPFNSSTSIASTCGLWLNNSSATINTTGGTITLLGYLRATSGIINIGNASDNSLSSNGGAIIIEGGTMNIAGRFDDLGLTALTNFNMSAGQLTVATSGSTSATLAPFNITETGSTFNLSGGTIIIRKSGTGNLGYLNTGGTVGTVSGGTIQIGDASTPASQTIKINSNISIPNLVISNGVAVTAQLISNSLTVKGNITINSGTLNANSLNINLAGNWSNSGTFTAGTGTVIFNGTAQSLSGSATSFNNLTFSNSGIKTLTSVPTVNGILSMEGTATISAAPTYGSSATLQYNTTSSRNCGSEWITPFVASGGVTNANTGTITLNASKTLTSGLSLTGGKVAIGTNTLTLNGGFSGSATNCLIGSSTSNLTVGNVGAIGILYIDQTTVGTTNRLQNLTINRSSQTVTLGNIFEVKGTVTLSNGTLASSGFLTLVSDSLGTARIGQITGTGAITGNVNIQRFIPGGNMYDRAYRFLSSVTSGQTFAASWQQDIHITGPGTGGSTCPTMTPNSNGFDNNSSTISSIYTYNEATGAWTSISNTNATYLNSKKGYRVFVRGNRAQGCALLTTSGSSVVYGTPQNVTIKSTGTITTGTVVDTLTYTASKGAGWNFITNPYPSAIDWANSSWVAAKSSNISSTIYIWNPAIGTAGAYASYNTAGGSVNGGSNIIQSGQAFFAKTTGTATLTFQEAYKSTDRTTQLFGKTALSNNLKLQLKDSAGFTDEVVVFTYPGATNSIDNTDGLKMGFGNGSIATYTSLNDTALTFNALQPFVVATIDTVFVKVGLNTNKSYSLNFIGTRSFINNIHPYLFDKLTSTLTDLTFAVLYNFVTNSNPNSYSQNRFYLIFANPSSLPVMLNSFIAEKQENTVDLKWNTSSEINSSAFVVERSTDAINFVEIANVKAAGNSSQNINYSTIDAQPNLSEVNYYRLKQIDIDGKYTYSSIQVVDFNSIVNAIKSLNVWSNPTTGDNINFTINNSNYANVSVIIIDFMGRVVNNLNINKSNNNYVIPVGTLKQGAYLMKVYSNDILVNYSKFIKE